MSGRVENLLERIAIAQEEQVAFVRREVEQQEAQGTPPSVCPFCETQNPEVTQLRLGEGNVDDFVLVGETHCCNKRVYAVPVQMVIVPNLDALEEVQKMKKGGSDGAH